MQDIHDWLRSQVADVVSQGAQGDAKSDLEHQAKLILNAGINAGYTNEEIRQACGGDLEAYLLEEIKGSTQESIQRGMERDKYSG